MCYQAPEKVHRLNECALGLAGSQCAQKWPRAGGAKENRAQESWARCLILPELGGALHGPIVRRFAELVHAVGLQLHLVGPEIGGQTGLLLEMGHELAETFARLLGPDDVTILCDPVYFGGTVDRSEGSERNPVSWKSGSQHTSYEP